MQNYINFRKWQTDLDFLAVSCYFCYVLRKTIFALAALTVLVLGGVLAWNWLQDNRMPNFQKAGDLYVYPGDGVEKVIQRICKGNEVKDRKSLERTFAAKKVSEFLTPGHYYISKNNSSVYVARMLNNGWQSPVKLTLTGNLRIKSNIAAKIASQLLIDSATVHNALNDAELLAKYDCTPRSVFSLLMPDTYEIYWTASIEDILDKQKAAVDAFWTPANLQKAKNLNLNRQTASILASIVDAESNYEPEMPKIAGVYLNRIKIGMPLQADPTVAFCFNYKPQRILKKHLEVDSAYNTYKHTGLPPGPICVPTRAALEAVLNPDFGGVWGNGNLYFCANSDFSGTHAFARTLSEHNANAAAFQKEMTRRHREKMKAN